MKLWNFETYFRKNEQNSLQNFEYNKPRECTQIIRCAKILPIVFNRDHSYQKPFLYGTNCPGEHF